MTVAFGLTNGSREVFAGWRIPSARPSDQNAAPRSAKPAVFQRSTVAKPELGSKHQCHQCGTKFFDLNKSPVICPKCGAIQQIASPRSVRAAVPEKEEVEVEQGVELVSLDEAEAAEPSLETAADDDVEIENEPADDTFLEEEEEDTDDVSGLIDGEIAPDEER
ncbi:MAG: TIGR02300 family protein [Methylovirgula sp.]